MKAMRQDILKIVGTIKQSRTKRKIDRLSAQHNLSSERARPEMFPEEVRDGRQKQPFLWQLSKYQTSTVNSYCLSVGFV